MRILYRFHGWLIFAGHNFKKKSTIRKIGIICTCSDHGQSRYQIWIKCDKRQMTSCIHKMCERTYGQTNMKRADLSMHILIYRFHGWLIFARVIALFMFVWLYVRSHILCTQLVIYLLLHCRYSNIPTTLRVGVWLMDFMGDQNK
jgi:hypothetical protein